MLETIVSLLLLLNKPVVMVTFLSVHRERRTQHLLQLHQQLLGCCCNSSLTGLCIHTFLAWFGRTVVRSLFH